MPKPPVLRRAKNGWFYAYWSERGRSKRESMGTKEAAEAQVKFAQWILLGGTEPVAPEAGADTYTIADCWSVYEERHIKTNVMAAERLDYAWKNLDPHFGLLVVSNLSQDKINSYKQKRLSGEIGRPSQGPTVRREINAMLAAIRFCATPPNALFSRSAIDGLDGLVLPDDGAPRDRWLKDAEIDKLKAAATAMRRGKTLTRGERFIWIALETAARKEAIMDLTWDRVDFETLVIDFNVPGRKRTKKRRAVVPISKALLPILQRAHKERTNDLVMTNKGAIWKTVQRIAVNAGIGEKIGGKAVATGISPHVFRHTALTRMARRGVPLWIVSKIAADTLATVERVYAKHSPEDLRAGIDMISGDDK